MTLDEVKVKKIQTNQKPKQKQNKEHLLILLKKISLESNP